MSIGIPLDGTDRAGLGGTEGRVDGGRRNIERGADRGRRNIERGADRGRVKRVRAAVIDWNVDWKASLVNRAWSILWVAAYQASGSVSAGRPKGMVAIWLWMFDLSPRQNFTTRVWGSVYPALETRVRKVSK